MPMCCVPGCKSGYKSCVEKVPTFQLPIREPKLLELWKQKIPRKEVDKFTFSKAARVCEKHFKVSDVIWHDEHIINGKIEKLIRSRPKLKPGAVPCIFFSLPSCLSDNNCPRKSPKKRVINSTETTVAATTHEITTPTPSEDPGSKVIASTSTTNIKCNEKFWKCTVAIKTISEKNASLAKELKVCLVNFRDGKPTPLNPGLSENLGYSKKVPNYGLHPVIRVQTALPRKGTHKKQLRLDEQDGKVTSDENLNDEQIDRHAVMVDSATQCDLCPCKNKLIVINKGCQASFPDISYYSTSQIIK